MSRVTPLLILLSLAACETRSPAEKKPVPNKEQTPTPETPRPPEVVVPKPPPKEEGPIADAMAYTLVGSTGVFVIDVQKLTTSSLLTPSLSALTSLLSSSLRWAEFQREAMLDPAKDITAVVISFRQSSGGTATDMMISVAGTFEAESIAKKANESTIPGDKRAEAVGGHLLIFGEAPLIEETKAGASQAALATSPALVGAFTTLDKTRSVYGVFLPPEATRHAASGAERASQVTLELDFTSGLLMKTTMKFDTSKEAEDAKREIDDGIKQMVPAMGALGVPDTSKLASAFSVSTDGDKMTASLTLEEATASTVLKAILGFIGVTPAPVTPPPATPPPPPTTPPVRSPPPPPFDG